MDAILSESLAGAINLFFTAAHATILTVLSIGLMLVLVKLLTWTCLKAFSADEENIKFFLPLFNMLSCALHLVFTAILCMNEQSWVSADVLASVSGAQLFIMALWRSAVIFTGLDTGLCAGLWCLKGVFLTIGRVLM